MPEFDVPIYEAEDHFYCDKARRNCPFSSQFRYCFDCTEIDLPDLCAEVSLDD